MEVSPAERRLRLGKCGFKEAHVTDAGTGTGLDEESFVKRDDFTQREVSHYASRR